MIIKECGCLSDLRHWNDSEVARAKKTILRLSSIPKGEGRIKIYWIHRGWGRYDFSINDQGSICGIDKPRSAIIKNGVSVVSLSDLDMNRVIVYYLGCEPVMYSTLTGNFTPGEDQIIFSCMIMNLARVRFDWKDIAGVLIYQDYMRELSRTRNVKSSVEFEKARNEIIEYAKLRSRWFKAKEGLKKCKYGHALFLLNHNSIDKEWVDEAENEIAYEQKVARDLRISEIRDEKQTAKGAARQLRALGVVA